MINFETDRPIVITKGSGNTWYAREKRPFTLVDTFLTLAGACVILRLLNLLLEAVAIAFYF